MAERKSYVIIDFFKMFSAVLIILLHTEVLLSVSAPLQMIIRNTVLTIAVPFFFTVSGFFFFKKLISSDNKAKIFKQNEKRVIQLYLIYTAIYFPFVLRSWIVNGFSAKSILLYIRDFFFVGSFSTIWYLLALIAGFAIAYALFIKIGLKKAFYISIAFYAFGVLTSSYYGIIEKIPVVSNIVDGYYTVFGSVKNGLTFGLVYILLGGLIATAKEDRTNNAEKKYFIITAIGTVGVCGEAVVQYVMNWALKGVDLKFSLLVFTYGLIMFLINLENKFKNHKLLLKGENAGKHFRKLSTLMFLTQRIPITICEILGVSGMNSLVYTVIILASTVAISEAIILGSRKIKVLKYLY